MTRDEILQLEPGPELDRLVAERVMGWHREPYRNEKFPRIIAQWKDANGEVMVSENIDGSLGWSPSIDIVAAWEVVEVLYMRGMVPEVYGVWFTRKKKWVAMFWYDTKDGMNTAKSEARSLPLAICRAALLAVMGVDGE